MSASSLTKNTFYGLGLTVWVVFALYAGQTIAALILSNVVVSGNQTATESTAAALGYIFGLILAIAVPAVVTKKPIDRKVLGIDRLPSWSDIGLSLLSVVPYYIAAAGVIWFGVSVLKVIDPTVGQQIGFANVVSQFDYLLVFITFVVMAPLAEELLFRGYLLGNISKKWNKWLAVIATAVVFGLLHVPGFTADGIVLQWGAAADTFTMGLVAGILRMLTGNIWAGMILHGIKNSIAFYFLFINPLPPGGM